MPLSSGSALGNTGVTSSSSGASLSVEASAGATLPVTPTVVSPPVLASNGDVRLQRYDDGGEAMFEYDGTQWNLLYKTNPPGASRKFGLDDLGDVSGVVDVDFTALTSDNKLIRVIGPVTALNLTFGQPGEYKLLVDIGAVGSAIPQPANVAGVWMLEDTLNATNHVTLMWDGDEATVQSITLDED